MSDAEHRFGVAIGTVPSHYTVADWAVVTDPEPSRVIIGGDGFALVYRGDTWEAAAAGVGVDVVCACGGFTTTFELTAGP